MAFALRRWWTRVGSLWQDGFLEVWKYWDAATPHSQVQVKTPPQASPANRVAWLLTRKVMWYSTAWMPISRFHELASFAAESKFYLLKAEQSNFGVGNKSILSLLCVQHTWKWPTLWRPGYSWNGVVTDFCSALYITQGVSPILSPGMRSSLWTQCESPSTHINY